MARGREIGARHFLSSQFNPDHEPDNHPVPVSKDERRRRDEYRIRMGAQVEK